MFQNMNENKTQIWLIVISGSLLVVAGIVGYLGASVLQRVAGSIY